MDGGLVVDEGSIYDFLSVMLANISGGTPKWWMKAAVGLRYVTRRLRQINTPVRARRNVQTHYDLDGRLYSLFLDNDLQYSCAYFEDDDASLEEAQLAKKRHLAAKLALEPGQRVLDIGSGWGGLALYLAEHADVDVTGVTLSDEQFAVSNRRAAEKGLGDRVRFLLRDYRQIAGPFDRVVSVGMFEHVGVGHYRQFFRACKNLLSQGRRHRPAFDRPLRRAGRYQSVDPEIHFSGRLHPGNFGGHAGGRAERPEGDRRGDPAAPLRQDAAQMARTVHGAPRRDQSALRRALLPDVGVLSRRIGDLVPVPGPDEFPDPDRQASGGRAPHPQLHVGSRGAPARRRHARLRPRAAEDREANSDRGRPRRGVSPTAFGRSRRQRDAAALSPATSPRASFPESSR